MNPIITQIVTNPLFPGFLTWLLSPERVAIRLARRRARRARRADRRAAR